MNKLKKLTQVELNQQGKVLPKEQMMKILEGGSYACMVDGQLCCFIGASDINSCTTLCKSYYGERAGCS